MSRWSRRGFVQLAGVCAGALATGGIGSALSAADDDPTGPPPDSTLFRRAVEAGDLPRVRAYLDRDPGLMYCRDARGRSVFVLAHLAGHPGIGQLLQERGLQLDLVEASIVSDWDRVEEIGKVSPGLVNAYHPIGGTALYAAALFGAGGPMWRLAQLGGDVNGNPLGAEGVTPARGAVECRDIDGAIQSTIALLGNGAEANSPQRGGNSVLHVAATRGNAYLVRFVIRRGGDVGARNAAGETPLDVAEKAGHPEVIEMLRNHESIVRNLGRNDPRSSRFASDASGKPYRRPDLSGRPQTLVNRIVGASHGRFDAVKSLAGQHPDIVHGVSSSDEMTIEASAHMGHRPMIDFYLERGAPLSLPTCLTMGNLDRARQLLRENPARIRERGPHDFALTWYPAIRQENLEAAELLVESGIEVGQEGGTSGLNALHFCARAGRVELSAYWIEQGVDVNARTIDGGKTPLDLARERKHTEVAALLASKGGRPGRG